MKFNILILVYFFLKYSWSYISSNKVSTWTYWLMIFILLVLAEILCRSKNVSNTQVSVLKQYVPVHPVKSFLFTAESSFIFLAALQAISIDDKSNHMGTNGKRKINFFDRDFIQMSFILAAWRWHKGQNKRVQGPGFTLGRDKVMGKKYIWNVQVWEKQTAVWKDYQLLSETLVIICTFSNDDYSIVM